MKNRFFIFGFVAISLVSCRTSLNVANVKTEKNTFITNDLQEDPTYSKAIAPYTAKLVGEMNTKISHTAVDLNKNGDNSNLGELLADYTYQGAENWAKQNGISTIDAAVINIGGIRSTIGKGDILTKHIYEVMPFENELVIVKIKGNDLQGLFDYYLKTQKNNPVSHISVETENGLLTKQLINGQPIMPTKDYYIATSDYLALGGDNMSFFGKGKIINTGIKLRDLFLKKFKDDPEVVAPNDIRLLFKNKNKTKTNNE